ncbi:MAG: hypothetical protein H0Z34_04710 [Brevibacillus sp.]|nr:hypothetical protein [Brevibacillus sp.]
MAKSFVRKMAALPSELAVLGRTGRHTMLDESQKSCLGTSVGVFSPANERLGQPASETTYPQGIAAAAASRRKRDVVLALPLWIVVK